MASLVCEEQKMMERFQRLHSPHFGGGATKDAQGFVDQCHIFCDTLGLLELNGVDFTTFQLSRMAYRRWQTYESSRPTRVASLTWSQFSVLFLGELIPQTYRDELRSEFEHLR